MYIVFLKKEETVILQNNRSATAMVKKQRCSYYKTKTLGNRKAIV